MQPVIIPLDIDSIFVSLKSLSSSDLFKIIEQSTILIEEYRMSSEIQSQIKPISRTRDTAKKNEEADLKIIVEALNNPYTLQGLQLRAAFKADCGLEIEAARQPEGAGGRKKHYDFEILVAGIWYKVEHKGSIAYKNIDTTLPPWTGGVQFYNGTGKSYTLGHIYARQWYDRYIANGVLSRKYNITVAIPNYETWFSKDAMRQGDPTTPFGLELRSKFRGENISNKKDGCFDERDEMVRDLVISHTDLETIKTEVLTITQNVLKEKDYWLQINGDINGKFYCKWSPILTISSITDVKRIPCSDVQLEFITDMGFPIIARLRWGKGQGLSNIRIDLK